VSDPNKGKYTRKLFKREFEKAQERLLPLGGRVEAGIHDYEAFTYSATGIKLIFYPHKTTAGNQHIRVRTAGKCDPEKVRQAITALAENSCTFQFPGDRALHSEAVMVSLAKEAP
jgi:RNA 3'-terminal phosphate cyclase